MSDARTILDFLPNHPGSGGAEFGLHTGGLKTDTSAQSELIIDVVAQSPVAVLSGGKFVVTDGLPSSPATRQVRADFDTAFQSARGAVRDAIQLARDSAFKAGTVAGVSAGAAAAIAMLGVGGGTAHADAPPSQPVTPGTVLTLEKSGDTFWREAGKIPGLQKKLAAVLLADGVDNQWARQQEPGATLSVASAFLPGAKTAAAPVAIVDADAPPSQPVTPGTVLTLEKSGDTFWREAGKIPGLQKKLAAVLRANGVDDAWARQQQVGAKLPVPAAFLPGAKTAVAPEAPVPVVSPQEAVDHVVHIPPAIEIADNIPPPPYGPVATNPKTPPPPTDAEMAPVSAPTTDTASSTTLTPTLDNSQTTVDTAPAPTPEVAVDTTPAAPTPADTAPAGPTVPTSTVPPPPTDAEMAPVPPTADTTSSTTLPVTPDTAQPTVDTAPAPTPEVAVDTTPAAPTPADAVPGTPAAPDNPTLVPADTTTTDVPAPAPAEVAPAPRDIKDALNALRSSYSEGKADIGDLGTTIANTGTHPNPEDYPKDKLSADMASKLYVLPDRESNGLNFVVNPATCSDEAWATAPMQAFIFTISDYATWLTENDPAFAQYKGVLIQIGDIIAGSHKTHQFTTMVDLRSVYPTDHSILHPDGPLLMSNEPSFSKEFTAKLYQFAFNLTYDGKPVLKALITASKLMHDTFGKVVIVRNDHGDHTHFILSDDFGIGTLSPNPYGLSCDNPDTGGHTPAELPVGAGDGSAAAPIEVAQPASQDTVPVTPDTAPAPANSTAEALTASGEWKFVDGWQNFINNDASLTAEQKAFMIQIGEAIMAEVNKGAPINAPAVWAQVMIESGWGTGPAAKYDFNILSVKGNRDDAAAYPENYNWIHDDEFKSDGSPELSPFKKYGSYEEAIHDYIQIITSSKHFVEQGAVRCRFVPEQYLNALMNALKEDCSVGKRQGEKGVYSYASDPNYVSTTLKFMKARGMDRLMQATGKQVTPVDTAIADWLAAP